MANDIEAYFRATQGRLIHKWMHYFDIYDRWFHPFRGQPITLIELGVYHGGSLQMWRDYFGPHARIVGVDVDPRCAELGGPGTEVIIGDQDDREFLAGLAAKLESVDIVIDDGGHRMTQQLGTLEELWPIVVPGGIYLAEDLHTSYWPEYGGGPPGTATFLERVKALVDDVNAWDAHGVVPVTQWTRTIRGLHVYDKVVVLEKAVIETPHHYAIGQLSFEDPHIGDVPPPP